MFKSKHQSIVGKCLIALIISQAIFTDVENIQSSARVWNPDGMDPGMILRIDQGSVNGFKKAMYKFLPHYLETDMPWPTEYEFYVGLGDVLWGLLTWHVTWTNIEYSKASFDTKDIRVNFEKEDDSMRENQMTVHFPLFKEWYIVGDQKVDSWWMPADGPVELVIDGFVVDAWVQLEQKRGFLNPIFYDLGIDFGDSYLYHENWWAQLMMWQTVKLAFVIVKNGMFFFGRYVFNDMFAGIIDTVLHNYHYFFYLNDPVDGADQKAMYNVDYRMTRDPYIGNGHI